MTDLPEPHKKPQYSPKIVGWAVAAGAIAAIAAAILLAAAPPSPYSNLLAATVASAVAVGVGLFLAALVTRICEYFRRRHTRTEESIAEYQAEMIAYLNHISDQQRLLIAMVCDLTDQVKTTRRNQHVLHNRVERWKGEVTVLAQAVSDLQDAFIEEGLPEQREQ